MLTDQQNTFLSTAATAAVAAEKTTGLPAELTLAQAIYESGWGARMPGNNCFGIKPDHHGAGTQYFVSREFLDGTWQTMPEAFEKYDTLAQCFDDHARLITQGLPYAAAWATYCAGPAGAPRDVDAFILAMGAIYATAPGYGASILAEARSATVSTALAEARSVKLT